MLQAIWPDQQADIRELIVQTESTTAAHAVVVGRPGPGPIQDRYEIDEALTMPAPTSIAVVDDVLTTGAHFRAARAVLASRFSTAAAIVAPQRRAGNRHRPPSRVDVQIEGGSGQGMEQRLTPAGKVGSGYETMSQRRRTNCR